MILTFSVTSSTVGIHRQIVERWQIIQNIFSFYSMQNILIGHSVAFGGLNEK